MTSKRVYELAKELDLNSKELIKAIKEMGIPVSNHMSALDSIDVERVLQYYTPPEEKEVIEKRIKPSVIRRRVQRLKPEPETVVMPEPELETVPSEPPAETEAEGKTEELIAEADLTSPAPQEEITEELPVSPDEPAEGEAVTESAAEKKLEDRRGAIKETTVEAPTVSGVRGPFAAERKKGLKKRPKDEPAKVISKPIPPPAEEAKTDTEKKKEPSRPKKKRVFVSHGVPETETVAHKTGRKAERSIIEVPKVKHGRERRVVKGKKVERVIHKKTEITTPKAIKRKLKISEVITVGDLSKRMGIKASEVIQKLWELGLMANINQSIDADTAQLVAEEFGYEIEKVSLEAEEILAREEDDIAHLVHRPPVITVMGHVDHGKTKLLDAIRETNVMGMEAGGITQHIGAYHVKLEQGEIVFIDTPGHEAFTAMRARGSQVTDIVVLVVAASEGVKEQTVEAINHAKAAKVPIIVAVNKMDLAEADPERVTRELSDHGLIPEAWGGDTIYVELSAKEKTNIDKLLEMILIQAEVLELKANPDKLARGVVIESRVDKGQGPVATVLIQEGTLKAGDPFVSGQVFGKVRAMLTDRGKKIKKAGPSMPVEVVGFNGPAEAGNTFIVVSEERKARLAVEHRQEKARQMGLTQTGKVTLENLYDKIRTEEFKEFKLIIKADVHGSIEALEKAIRDIDAKGEVKLNLIHGTIGAINESDVMLASASNAIIIGFNVTADNKAQELAAAENVDIRTYSIIYEVIDDIKKAMEGLLSPIQKEKILGRAEVTEVFHVSKVGTIAGSKIVDGKMIRGAQARLFRNNVIVHEGKISTLRRFKDDVKEVLAGFECGIKLENFNDVHLNDIIEAFVYEEVAQRIE
ncbi:MAG: translation initiation factor IF-2 [Deltaproteobacteria bacterium]|nr:translation initiation factor IF-2 [Deltaproteobacteria bacterium]